MDIKKSENRWLAGVAGGIAEYQRVNPLVVRILWVVGGLITSGLAVVAYIILAFIMAPPSNFDINDFRQQ